MPSLRSIPKVLWWFAACGSAAFVACGSPQGLDESLFPPEYEGDLGSAGTLGAAQGGAGSVAAGNGGTGNTGNTGGRGGGQSAGGSGGGTGQSGSSNLGGNGGRAQTGTGGTANAGMGGMGQMMTGGGSCPSDITVLFNRPSAQGGCADSGCHTAGGFPPDLVSPNIDTRLLNVASTCQGIPYLGAGDSFIADKVTSPACGSRMPLFNEGALSAADRTCIQQWAERAGGGG